MSKNRCWCSDTSTRTSRIARKFLLQIHWMIRNKMYESDFLWEHFHFFSSIVQKSCNSLIYIFHIKMNFLTQPNPAQAQNYTLYFIIVPLLKWISWLNPTQPNPTQPMIEINKSYIYISIPCKNEFPDPTQGILKRRLFVCIFFSPGKYICYTYV